MSSFSIPSPIHPDYSETKYVPPSVLPPIGELVEDLDDGAKTKTVTEYQRLDRELRTLEANGNKELELQDLQAPQTIAAPVPRASMETDIGFTAAPTPRTIGYTIQLQDRFTKRDREIRQWQETTKQGIDKAFADALVSLEQNYADLRDCSTY